MSVPDISVEVAKKVTAIGQDMKSRATRGSWALTNAELWLTLPLLSIWRE